MKVFSKRKGYWVNVTKYIHQKYNIRVLSKSDVKKLFCTDENAYYFAIKSKTRSDKGIKRVAKKKGLFSWFKFI